jgi:Probable molybdopterin binding domain
MAMGIDLKEVRVVGDEEGAIVDALNALRHRYTYVFSTGGIGPTQGDISRLPREDVRCADRYRSGRARRPARMGEHDRRRGPIRAMRSACSVHDCAQTASGPRVNGIPPTVAPDLRVRTLVTMPY